MNEHAIQSVNMVTIGDPTLPVAGTTIGPWKSPDHWIGDFQPNALPYTPNVFPFQPTIIQPNPNVNCGGWTWPTSSIVTLTGANPWKLTPKADSIEAQIDVPGCKAEGIELELSNGKLSVKATRTKAGGYLHFDTFIGMDYDPTSAEACVEDGVLTVVVMRFKDKVARRIPVSSK